MRPRERKIMQKRVGQRISHLFAIARDRAASGHRELAQRCIHLARKLAMRARLSLPSSLRRTYCSHCYVYFPLSPARVRLQKGKLVYTCSSCHKHSRFVYGKQFKRQQGV